MSKDKIAAQMYTVREHTCSAEELAETLKKISDIGYTAVQMSAIKAMKGDNPEVSASEAKKMLDDNGLQCIATHRPWDSLLENTELEIEFHQQLGCDFAAIGGIPKDAYGDTEEGYRRFLQDASQVISKLKQAGIRFGHHNHAREFVRIKDGRWLEEILIDEGGPDLMLELDLYWVEHAGVNCLKVLEKSHGRVPVIHLKDKEVVAEEKEPVMAPIGEGNMDWDEIIPACEQAGVRWYAVEQDVCRRDAFDCLKASYDFLRGKGL